MKRELMVWITGVLIGFAFGYALAARAEHVTHNGCNTCTQTGPSSYECTAMYCVDPKELAEFQRKMDAHKKDDCLAKMEAAMLAMDKYVYITDPRLFPPVQLDPWPECAACAAEEERQYIKNWWEGRGKAVQQWDAVKQACWREK